MSKSYHILILICAIIVSPAALHAQSPTTSSQGLELYGAGQPLAADAVGPTDARMIRPAVAAFDLHASPDRPDVFASADAAYSAEAVRPRTAIDHRFEVDGLVGSVGYRRPVDSRPIAEGEAGLAASSGFDRQSGLAGAWLSYHFN